VGCGIGCTGVVVWTLSCVCDGFAVVKGDVLVWVGRCAWGAMLVCAVICDVLDMRLCIVVCGGGVE
jgi:hypothetical protein